MTGLHAALAELAKKWETEAAHPTGHSLLVQVYGHLASEVRALLDEHPATSAQPGEIAAADGWDLVNPDALLAAAVHGVAWELLEQTSDTADRPPSEESITAARATAVKVLSLGSPQACRPTARVEHRCTAIDCACGHRGELYIDAVGARQAYLQHAAEKVAADQDDWSGSVDVDYREDED